MMTKEQEQCFRDKIAQGWTIRDAELSVGLSYGESGEVGRRIKSSFSHALDKGASIVKWDGSASVAETKRRMNFEALQSLAVLVRLRDYASSEKIALAACNSILDRVGLKGKNVVVMEEGVNVPEGLLEALQKPSERRVGNKN